MKANTLRSQRIPEVRKIFEEHGFGNVELLEGWDGEELGELEDLLSEEEFQTLLDALETSREEAPR